MISTSDRRIFTFPLIHPCSDASPSTILSSLIEISDRICQHKKKVFVTNKKEIKVVIREIEMIHMLLREIHDSSMVLPNSFFLGFFELHLTYQKMLYILEDCTREGSQIWCLMKSECIADEIRVLVRTIGMAIDVLPLDSIVNLSPDVKDIVVLVSKQAQKVNIQIDSQDEAKRKDVLSICREFGKKIIPDSRIIKQIMQYLKINLWSDCNKSIKFLQSELELENSREHKKTLSILSNLIGFMNFSRSVAFDLVDDQALDQNFQKTDRNYDECMLKYLNPEDFRCPISLEIMTDPVTLLTGQTYDRKSITKWFKSGNRTCPKTGKKLDNMNLIPNSVLLKIIQEFNGVHRVPREKTEKKTRHSVAISQDATVILSNFLVNKLSNGSEEEKIKSTFEIRILSRSCEVTRVCLAEAGVMPLLLNQISSKSPTLQAQSMAALLHLSKCHKNRYTIGIDGGVYRIANVLINGLSQDAREFAAGVLFYLTAVEEYRKCLGELPESIPSLVGLIENGSNRGKKNALFALYGLLVLHENHKRILGSRAIPRLMNILTSRTSDLFHEVLWVLTLISEKPEGTRAIMKSLPVKELAEILTSSSQPVQEQCVSLLLSLCINSEIEAQRLVLTEAPLMAALYHMLAEGNSRSRKRVSSLLRLLYNYEYEIGIKSLSIALHSAIHQEPLVLAV